MQIICNMIIGFLGKGGSGKTTLATIFTKYLLENGKKILAIDADHNMDYSFNIGARDNINYIGASLNTLKDYVDIGLDKKSSFREIFLIGPKNTFNVFPNDSFTENYAKKIDENLEVLVAGPHTEEIWEGDKCSHSLFTSLKVYLPYLHLKDNEFVIIDEKAGMDPVGTMVPAGFDIAIISVEPTLHSVKTANQIAQGLKKYNTPYLFVGNKIMDENDKTYLNNNLYNEPVEFFPFNKEKVLAFENTLTKSEFVSLGNILNKVDEVIKNSLSSKKRAIDFWTGLKK